MMLNRFGKRTRAQRQAAEVHCVGHGIPVREVMAMLDTDFASDPQTCVEDEDFSDEMKERRIRAGVGEKAHKVVGQTWRSPDVSDENDVFLIQSCLPRRRSTPPSYVG
jgi:hypothetical protein